AGYSLALSSGLSAPAGTVSAARFSGDGSALTGVSASQVAAGSVQAGSLGAEVLASSIAVNAVQDASIVSLSASKLSGSVPEGGLGNAVLRAGGSMSGPLTLSGSTLTVAGQDAAGYSLALSSGLSAPAGTVSAARFSGDGSALTGVSASQVAAGSVQAGSLGAEVLASSIAVNAVQDGAVVSVSASKLLGSVPAGNLANAVLRSGGAMTGPLTLSGSTLTVTGSAFSVGSSALALTGGSLGIGTSAPATKVHVKGTSPRLFMETTTTGGAGLHMGGSGAFDGREYRLFSSGSQNTAGPGKLVFYDSTASANRMVLDEQGRFGVATATPSATLDVAGDAAFGSAKKSTFTSAGALLLASGSGLTLSGAAGTITTASSVTASAFFGDGSGLTNVSASQVAAAGVQAGGLGAGVIASSIAVNAVQDGAVVSVSASKLLGIVPAGNLANAVLRAGDSMTGPLTLSGSTLTVTGQDAAGYSLALSSGLSAPAGTVSAARFVGDGSGLSGVAASQVAAADVQAGSLGAGVLASSVAVNAVQDGAIVAMSASKLLGSVPAGNLANAVLRAGDTMTGPLTLSASTLTVAGNAFSVSGTTFTVGLGQVGIGTASPEARLQVLVPNAYLAPLLSLDGVVSGWPTLRVSHNNLSTNVGVQVFNTLQTEVLRIAPYQTYFSGSENWVAGRSPMVGIGYQGGGGFGGAAGNFSGSLLGTYLAVNASSGYAGSLMDLQTYGSSRLVVQGAGNVGVGTAVPAARLEVSSPSAAAADVLLRVSSGSASSQTLAVVKGDGKTGFGTDSPQASLHAVSSGVPGRLERSSALSNPQFLQLYNPGSTDGSGAELTFLTDTTGGGASTGVKVAGIRGVFATHDHGAREGRLQFLTAQGGAVSEAMTVLGSGWVGVGTTAPTHGLDVAAGGVIVRSSVTLAAMPAPAAPASGRAALFLDSSDGKLKVSEGGAYVNLVNPASAGGWSDDGGVIRLADGADNVVVQSTLTVQGNAFSVGGSTLTVAGGAVGIGNADPAGYKLRVSGAVRASAFYDEDAPAYFLDPSVTGGGVALQLNNGTIAGVNELVINDVGEGVRWADGNAYFRERQSAPLGLEMGDAQGVFFNSGKVAISTMAPTHQLDVNGGAIFRSSLTLAGMGAPEAAGSGQGAIFFDSGENRFKVSEDGGPYAYLVNPASAGGWTDDGTAVRLTSSGDNVVVQSTLTVQGDAFSVGGSTLVVSGGWVGIGAAPQRRLDVAAGDEEQARILGQSAPARLVLQKSNGAKWGLTSDWNGEFLVFDYGSAVARLAALPTGRVGVGTAAPTARLHVSSAGATAGDAVLLVSSGTGAGQELVVVKGDGKVGIGSSAPNARLYVGGGANSEVLRFKSASGENFDLEATSNNQAAIRAGAGGRRFFLFETGAAGGRTTFNPDGGSIMDFRILSQTGAPMLFADASAGDLGVGTETPEARLEVRPGASSEYSLVVSSQSGSGVLRVDKNGNVLVGAPEVHDTVAGVPSLLVEGNLILDGQLIQHQAADSTFEKLGVGQGVAAGETFRVGAATMVVTAAGRVGIGTTNPGSTLDVAGAAKATGLQISGGSTVSSIVAAANPALSLASTSGGASMELKANSRFINFTRQSDDASFGWLGVHNNAIAGNWVSVTGPSGIALGTYGDDFSLAASGNRIYVYDTGTAAAPTLAKIDDTDTGTYWPSSNALAWST
ncbi:MAG: hypothetical protein HY554_06795, partial [Elusimicrobia bacterium]|nr:hypothetical protein [Elusimicrobiota bacterium]